MLLKRIYYFCKHPFSYHPKVQRHIKTKIMGNEYGGFAVAQDFLKGGERVYSFGIGEDISFDLSIIREYDCEVFAFDPTPKSIDWLKRQSLPERFHYYTYGISNADGAEEFHLPQNEEYVSGSTEYHSALKEETISVEMRRLRTIMQEMGHDSVDIIKMDIEGAEFRVIPDIIESGCVFKQLCIETHQRYYKEGRKRITEIIQLLNDNHYDIIYVSDNFEELTFLRNTD